MGKKNTNMKKADIGKLTSTADVPESAASVALRRTLLVKKLNTGRCTTSEELADRFDKLFNLATLNGFVPTVEMLALSSGINRRDLWEIENNISHKGSGMGDIIKEAKEVIATIEGQLAMTGDINSTVYIFRGKNFFNMVDKQEVVVTPNTGLQEQPNADEIINNVKRLKEGT